MSVAPYPSISTYRRYYVKVIIAEVRANFSLVLNGVRYAVDYIRKHFYAETLSNLPFTTLLVPLSVFFAIPGNKEANTTDKQRAIINRWFWRASFSRRYSSGVLRNLNSDIAQIRLLRENQGTELGTFAVEVGPSFFMSNLFGMNNVNTKTFILMLASRKPRSFISGAPVDLARTLKEANRTEFHHLMPRGFLKASDQNTKIDENILSNFSFLSRADNREIGAAAPSQYRKKMPLDSKAILEAAIVPETLFSDDFVDFVLERSVALANVANSLCEKNEIWARFPPEEEAQKKGSSNFVAIKGHKE